MIVGAGMCLLLHAFRGLMAKRIQRVLHRLPVRAVVGSLCLFLMASSASFATADTVTETPPDSLSLEFGEVSLTWVVSAPSRLEHEATRLTKRALTGPACEHAISDGCERILALLAGRGYRDAQIAPSRFSISSGKLSFNLTVELGPLTVVSGYRFADLERTDTTWLRSVADLPTDVPLTREWLSQANARLSGLSNLRVAAVPDVVVASPSDGERTEVLVVFHLAEIAPSRFDGLIAASNDGDVSALTGRAAMEFAGLFRRDRTASLRYNRQRPEQSVLNLRLAERGAFGRPLGWAFELDELNTAHRRQSVRGTIDFAFTASRRWHIGLSGMWRKVTSGVTYVPPARISELSVSLERQSGRQGGDDDVLRTRTSVTTSVAYSHRRDLVAVDSDPSSDRIRIQADAISRLQFAPSWAVGLSTSAQAWSVSSVHLGPGDEWYLGGVDMLRGYDEQSFAATSGVWTSLEISHTLAPQLTTSIFGETAYLRAADSRSQIKRPVCYGWALGMSSAQRYGRLEFAWRNGAALRDGFLRLKISQSW